MVGRPERPGDLAQGESFLLPDEDAFFSPGGNEVIATQEDDCRARTGCGPAGTTVSTDGSLPLPTSDMAVAMLGQSAYLIGGEGELGEPGQSVFVGQDGHPSGRRGDADRLRRARHVRRPVPTAKTVPSPICRSGTAL